MRKVTPFLLAAALLLPAPIASAASAKVGSTCSKAGSTAKASGKKLVCVKTGKKLLWKIATPVSVIPTTPTIEIRSAVSAKSGLGCELENQESFPLEGPLRCVKKLWTLVVEEDDSIASRAFRSVLGRYKSRSDVELALDLVLQDNFPSDLTYVPDGMKAAARLWSLPLSVQKYPVILGTTASWVRANAELRQLVNLSEAWASLEQQPVCSQALFVLPERPDKPWFMFCMGQPRERLNNFIGFIQSGAHEYTHLVQRYYLSELDPTKGGPTPPWLSEGTASYAATALGFAFARSADLRSLWLPQLNSVTSTLDAYRERMPSVWQDVYPLGMFAAEALVAVFGVDFIQQVYKARMQFRNFDEAMIHVTGKSLAQWTPILQGYVDSVKVGRPWSLEELKKRAA